MAEYRLIISHRGHGAGRGGVYRVQGRSTSATLARRAVALVADVLSRSHPVDLAGSPSAHGQESLAYVEFYDGRTTPVTVAHYAARGERVVNGERIHAVWFLEDGDGGWPDRVVVG